MGESWSKEGKDVSDVLFANNNNKALKRLAARSLKARKNGIAVLAIMLATLLFTSLFTVVISLQASMQDSEMRKTGTYAHAGIKHITLDEYKSLSSNKRLQATGQSIVIGMAAGDSFNKVPTEVRWADSNYAEWTYNKPDIGQLPKKEKELATSRIVLAAMGIPDEVGTQIELTYTTDDKIMTEKFTLSGIWDGDFMAYRQTILLSDKYTSIVAPAVQGGSDETVTAFTGVIDFLFMLPTAWNIEKQALEILEEYSLSDRVKVNPSYSTAYIDVQTVLSVLAGVLLIFIAGYLLIYNVFYISIAQDISFYGMLKTLGTTSRQIHKIVYKKAILLSITGIPLGLFIGWPIGRVVLPAIIGMLGEDMRVITTANPIIFVGAIIFSLLTVLVSCRKPAKKAAKVSPIEALRYVEQEKQQRKNRRNKYITPQMMARENMGRNKKKVVIVTLSFVLCIVLLNSMYTYIHSFDFDKFVSGISLTDFTVADATIIKSNMPFNTANVSKDFVSQANSLEGLENIGSIYLGASIQPLDKYALEKMKKLSEQLDTVTGEFENYSVRQKHGVNVYGFDDWPAQYLQVLEGDLKVEQWYLGNGIYVTPMRMLGDGTTALYEPGDQVTVAHGDGTNKTYEVLAVVDIPEAFTSPLGFDLGIEYALPTAELLKVVGTTDYLPMRTVFNVEDRYISSTENWLKNFTVNTEQTLDYNSKNKLQKSFQSMIDMYRIVGGVLCAILALIGILNFVNSMATSILSRHKEIAMLQSIGMTGRQVKKMLLLEGVRYSILGLVCSAILSALASVTLVRMLGNELTYFTWKFTLLPVVVCTVPLIIITAVIPLICYKKMASKTVVERMRVAE